MCDYKISESFLYLCVLYTLEMQKQGKTVDSDATRPNSTFNRRKVMRGRLAWALGRIWTGISNLSPNYVCGATLTRIPVRLSLPDSL